MFGQDFYFDLIRKYTILVGTLFDDISIKKTDKTGNVTSILKVPVTFANKDKMLARVTDDPALDKQTASLPLPMISFELGPIKYDRERKLHTIGRVAYKDPTNPSNVKYQYNFVPYDFSYKVYVYALIPEDGTKIIEQILPYFTPDWTQSCILIPEINERKDIPIVLGEINYEDNYDQAFIKRRAIVWTIDLTVKGYLYGPIKSNGVIKFININYKIPDVPDGLIVANNSVLTAEKQTIQPGLTANGQPTTNSALTIPYVNINVDDQWAYLTRILNDGQF